MFSVKLIEIVPPCCSHSHEAVGEVRAVGMFLCTLLWGSVATVQHTVLSKVLSDSSRY